MGVLNLTPDSFSDGGRYIDRERPMDCAAAVAAGQALFAAGATWLDIGGESSRPGATPIDAANEIARIQPIISALHAQHLGPISVDTHKAEVAKAAIDAGAQMINDIRAGADPAMFSLVAERRCAIVLMHMQGDPQTMQRQPHYHNVVDEVCAFLEARLRAAVSAGIAETAVLLDPGIGFGKTTAHNLALLRALPIIGSRLGRPLVVGISRKRFLGRLSGVDDAAQRDGISHVLHAFIAPWCSLLRVHDVAGARSALTESCNAGSTL